MTQTTAIKWTKVGTTYESECGRFTIRNISMTTRSRWLLCDSQRRDLCVPEFGWSEHCSSLASAKRKAERIAQPKGLPFIEIL